MLAQLLDVTERHNFEEHLRHMADHDPLTGLRNRRSFEQQLKEHCALVSRYGPQGALLILDLDNFKFVNDSLGHNAGDELIVGVARVLKERLRETDVLARLGGDEFAVLLPAGGAAEASAVAAALAEAIQNHTRYDIGSAQRSVTTSIGIALFDDPNVTADAVMVAADLAMYDAKEEGRNRYALAVTDQHPRSRTGSRISWAERIEAALAEDRFVLVAQPILDLREDRVHQYELLVRMRGEEGDLIPPAAFLYIAERVDLIQHIDRWVAEQAIDLLAGDESIKLEINISGKSLTDDSLLELIDGALSRSGIRPDRLIFEVTETAAVADIARARHFAEHLTGLGCRFALDDFGAGFGSFYYLKYLPFDYLKIDGEFIANCTTSAMDQTIVRGLVNISRELGKQTIAEYTHDAPTLALVRQLGVDHAQGYHISPPVPLGRLLTPTVDRR
jgi:diguanylate cyclase (GGDEF)-like protein